MVHTTKDWQKNETICYKISFGIQLKNNNLRTGRPSCFPCKLPLSYCTLSQRRQLLYTLSEKTATAHSLREDDYCTLSQRRQLLHTLSEKTATAHSLREDGYCTLSQRRQLLYTLSEKTATAHSLREDGYCTLSQRRRLLHTLSEKTATAHSLREDGYCTLSQRRRQTISQLGCSTGKCCDSKKNCVIILVSNTNTRFLEMSHDGFVDWLEEGYEKN